MIKILKEAFRRLLVMLLAFAMFTVVMILFLSFLGVLLQEPPVAKPDNAVLVIDTTFALVDQPVEASPAELVSQALGRGSPAMFSLKEVIDSINNAAVDPDIRALFLHGNILRVAGASSYASLLEVKRAIERFKKSGKPVISYLDYVSQRDYFLCSSADRVIMNPYGLIEFSGFAAERMYFGQAFEKYGIGVQTATMGAYKSAGDTFTRSQLSEEDREQLQVMLEDTWSLYLEEVAEARDLTVNGLQEIAAEKAILMAEEALSHRLVDELLYKEALLSEMKKTYGTSDDGETFQQISLGAYLATFDRPDDSENVVAVVYAEGVIVEGEGFGEDISGNGFSRKLREIRQDDSVKAVVLRINSPGGSASASEKILNEVKLLSDKMPVVVSMGGIAASGGYWIASQADTIIAEPNTLTGSIGVVFLLMHFNELANRVGITFDGVKTAPKADMLFPSRPKTIAEMDRIASLSEEIYEDFINRVAVGRGMDVDAVREIAGGRIWSGLRAVDIGLVDELGGLEEAIEKAANLADLEKDYRIEEYPRYKSLEESLAELFDPQKGKRFANLDPINRQLEEFRKEVLEVRHFNDPRQIYARLPFFLNLP